MKKLLILLTFFMASTGWAAGIPATPVMTLYRFNSPLDIAYYDIETFRRTGGPSAPAGTLAQGTSVVPCLVVSGGQPLTDSQGVPYVGFEVIVDSRTATPAATERYKNALKERQSLTVANHHCDASAQYVIDIRNLYAMSKAPVFDPPRPAKVSTAASDRLDKRASPQMP